MPEPKRHFLQIHLSTCIVLMFVAAAFIGVNVAPRRDLRFYTFHILECGWPCAFFNWNEDPSDSRTHWLKIGLLVDVGLFLLFITAATFVCELRIRRDGKVAGAALLVAAVGLMLWLNVTPSTFAQYNGGRPIQHYGWPLYALERVITFGDGEYKMSPFFALIDVLIAFVVPAGCVLIGDRLVGRRERLQP
jgi:hypothetical protein